MGYSHAIGWALIETFPGLTWVISSLAISRSLIEAFTGYTLYCPAIGWSMFERFLGYTLYLLAIGWSPIETIPGFTRVIHLQSNGIWLKRFLPLNGLFTCN